MPQEKRGRFQVAVGVAWNFQGCLGVNFSAILVGKKCRDCWGCLKIYLDVEKWLEVIVLEGFQGAIEIEVGHNPSLSKIGQHWGVKGCHFPIITSHKEAISPFLVRNKKEVLRVNFERLLQHALALTRDNIKQYENIIGAMFRGVLGKEVTSLDQRIVQPVGANWRTFQVV